MDSESDQNHDRKLGQVGKDERSLGSDRGTEGHVRAPHHAERTEEILQEDSGEASNGEQRGHGRLIVSWCAVGNVASCSGAKEVAEQVADTGARESLNERAAAGEDREGEADEQEQTGG